MKIPSNKKGLSRSRVKSRRKRTSSSKSSILETKCLENLKTVVIEGLDSVKSSATAIYKASYILHKKENNKSISTKEVIVALEVELKEGHPFYKAVHAGKVAFILKVDPNAYPYSSLAIFAQEYEKYWPEILELAISNKGKKNHPSGGDIIKAKNTVLDRYKPDKSDNKGTGVTNSGKANQGDVGTGTDGDDAPVIDENTIKTSVSRIVKSFPKKKQIALNVFIKTTPELLLEEINLMHECESIDNGRDIAIETLKLAISRSKKKSRSKVL